MFKFLSKPFDRVEIGSTSIRLLHAVKKGILKLKRIILIEVCTRSCTIPVTYANLTYVVIYICCRNKYSIRSINCIIDQYITNNVLNIQERFIRLE